MKKILTFALIGFIIVSCSSNDDNNDNSSPNTDYSEYISENTINTDINFMPEEIYSNSDAPQSPSLKLKLITVEEFPCVNYYLTTTTFINGNELIIRFENILEPEVCLTAIGPAISYIDLTPNTTKITFINGNEIDKYALEINQEKVSITLIESSFTNALYDNTFRIPENSFAYVCGTNTNNTNIYGDFSAILEQNPNFVEFQFLGEGRIPYPESSGGNWVNHPSKFFTYSDSEAYNNLGNILNEYAAENIEENSGVTISIYSWNNVNYYSWINN